ncbi:hypothetical protein D3C73_1042250 [compost metagenome]
MNQSINAKRRNAENHNFEQRIEAPEVYQDYIHYVFAARQGIAFFQEKFRDRRKRAAAHRRQRNQCHRQANSHGGNEIQPFKGCFLLLPLQLRQIFEAQQEQNHRHRLHDHLRQGKVRRPEDDKQQGYHVPDRACEQNGIDSRLGKRNGKRCRQHNRNHRYFVHRDRRIVRHAQSYPLRPEQRTPQGNNEEPENIQQIMPVAAGHIKIGETG